MKYRRLGKTNLRVSVVGVGTWQFGGEWGKHFTQQEVNDILARAKDLGVNLIDTAECYGDHLSERLIGHAIRGQRDAWILATKFGHEFRGVGDRRPSWSVDSVRRQLEDSLRALQTDVIDIYQFHSGSDQVFDRDELWTMLDKQVQAGKVRFLGISISSSRRMDPSHQARRASDVGASVLQIVYNRLDRRPETQIFPYIADQDLGVLARVPLASGFLTGKYKPGHRFTDPNDVRSTWDPEHIEQQLREAEKIARTEVPAGIPMAVWALAWPLQHPLVTCVIPGVKSVAQMEINASAADLDAMVREDHPQAWPEA
ncbi:MAG TPA: aldo/keto reductase [Anaerolineae bacterium]|nr:aldo/keto reductase [Anaerolineae bacterium]